MLRSPNPPAPQVRYAPLPPPPSTSHAASCPRVTSRDMPVYERGEVLEILASRPGLQRVALLIGSERSFAYVLTDVTGPVDVGNAVIVNTTAVELGLGTGGWHVVHWNLARDSFRAGAGREVKARYLSTQVNVEAADGDTTDLAGMPVVVAGLHSQVAAIAVAIKDAQQNVRVAYVMTDGGALPLAISDVVFELRERGLLDVTITCGQAFGADHEAVSVYSALGIARQAADVAIVAMGPGGMGTDSPLGFSAIEVGPVLDAVARMGGVPIATLRASAVDVRARHRGVSHHSTTALTTATSARALVAAPSGVEIPPGIRARHRVIEIAPIGIVDAMKHHGLAIESMGRPAADDPLLFECAAAAGVLASRELP